MHSPSLAHWLRLLWGRLPPLAPAPADAAPFIASGRMHLAPARHWALQRAAAAHMAAHLVYSPPGFDGEGLVPIARVLLATLEDARVEALAMRELPGLARLWRPLHTATPDSGEGVEALLQRLARALIDPGYHDPHAWVRKARRLFFIDEGLQMLALRTPAELRNAALVLGHDIGQARLPFNARGHRPQPAYRDDHRWMWPAERQEPAAPPPQPQPAEAGTAARPPDAPDAPDTGIVTTRQPEWDRLIHRLRHDWVTVREQPAPAPAAPDRVATATTTTESATVESAAATQALSRQVQSALRRLNTGGRSRVLAHEGETLDLDALVAWQMARRGGHGAQARVWRARQRQPSRPAAWLLVDQSASSGDVLPVAASPGMAGAAGPTRQIDVAASAAAAVAGALQRLRVACAISGFASHGRHAVRLHRVQGLHQPPLAAAALRAQLQALRCGGSTRLGAALRHVVQQLGRWRAGPRWLLLLSDAQAHDIDVHDPLYLPADARHAVRAAARRGVRVACLALGPPGGTAAVAGARQMFGVRGVQPLPRLQALPGALRRLTAP